MRISTRSSSSVRSSSYASAMRSTTGSSRFHMCRGCTVVPRPCSTRTRPRSSSIFRASRITVRLKPNCSQSAGSVGSTSPSTSEPPTIDSASSSTTTEAKRAGRHGGFRSRTCGSAMQSSYGLTMTPLGLGTAPLGGLFEEVPPEAARATIDSAWELGIRFFDTAPLYGSGLAEERLGEALAARPRDAFTLSTKVGRVLVPGERGLEPAFDFTPEGIRASLASSLERLGLDRVDIVLLHDPEEHMEETHRALDTVRPF